MLVTELVLWLDKMPQEATVVGFDSERVEGFEFKLVKLVDNEDRYYYEYDSKDTREFVIIE